jgi:cytochrome oxidase Cu insertion factor (SCO1/SenC/PrrC family)
LPLCLPAHHCRDAGHSTRPPERKAQQVEFTFVSFDSEQDTPAHLREFQAKNDFNSWIFLTGDNDAVLELSVALGVKIQKVGPSAFAHSNAIFVLAPDGRILHRQEDLDAKPDAAVKSILKELP